ATETSVASQAPWVMSLLGTWRTYRKSRQRVCRAIGTALNVLHCEIKFHEGSRPPVKASCGTPAQIILGTKYLDQCTAISVQLELLTPQILSEMLDGPIYT
ncbi:unnamed protein product, partial [Meganyctiphanes norvegica]